VRNADRFARQKLNSCRALQDSRMIVAVASVFG
jgi:hypothetical protein